MGEYRRGAHTVYEIHLHLVWTTKYRKAVLGGEAATRVPRNLWGSRHQDHEGARVERPRASTGVDTTAGDDQPDGAMAEGEDGAQNHAGVSAHQEAVLGTTHVGAR